MGKKLSEYETFASEERTKTKWYELSENLLWQSENLTDKPCLQILKQISNFSVLLNLSLDWFTKRVTSFAVSFVYIHEKDITKWWLVKVVKFKLIEKQYITKRYMKNVKNVREKEENEQGNKYTETISKFFTFWSQTVDSAANLT